MAESAASQRGTGRRRETARGSEGGNLGKRIVAWIIDSLIITVVIGGLFALIGFLILAAGDIGALFGTLALPIVSFFGLGYYIYCEGKDGQTIGKSVVDVRVVKQDGTEMDYAAAAIRNLLRIVDQLPFLYIVGIVVIVITDEGQRVGDIVADTIVVEE